MSSPPDGYTLLLHGSAGFTIYQAVMAQPAFDTLRDLTPISLVVYFDLILCANPALPFKTVQEFVAYAKANPGKLSYGSAGVGAMNHVGTEWFKTMAGIDIVHVPYRGDAPVAADLTAGVLGVSFVSSNVAIPLIHAGKLKALAVPSRQRIAVLPDVPTMAEAGYPDFDLQPWAAFFGPAGLDKTIVSSLDQSAEADPRRTRPSSNARRSLSATTRGEPHFGATHLDDREEHRAVEGRRRQGEDRGRVR